MNKTEAITWFKTTFAKEIEPVVAGTPFGVDLVVAIAYQETGYIWSSLLTHKNLSVADILELCVSDTIDADSSQPRSAFPKRKEDLIAWKDGNKMYEIAREALIKMSEYIPGFSALAKRPAKFCHGYGIFQYDLQFFKNDPDFFLQKKWKSVAACVAKCVTELKEAMGRQGWKTKTSLTDTERVYLGIAYNKGTASLAKGFKQGYKSDDGRYYGENIFEFLRIAQTIDAGSSAPAIAPEPAPNQAPLPAPTTIEVEDAVYMVDVKESPLRLRSEPKIPKDDPTSNVIARLPDGQMVHWISGKKGDTFLEVETSLNGAHFQGYAAAEFLIPVRKATAVVDVTTPAPADKPSPYPAVYMPRKGGSVTKRVDPAGALSLNEPGQPGRSGTTSAELVADLAKIIAWLAVDNPKNKRYQPTSTSTFCNIYAHDYAYLAGVYLPRVWWLPGAIGRLARGEKVEPLYENTIDEQRANDLFRWFRDFGADFGWRQTGTLTKLQEAANLGGIGIIVARRKEEGRSGHIVVVVPETEDERAKRNPNGEVTAPLQSQAGSVNFQYDTGKTDWWKGDQFADSAFWIHA